MYLHISGSRIGTEEALYLYTSGPDLTSIMPCKYGKPSGTFSKFVTEEALKCEHVREFLIKNKDVDTTALVVSLCLDEALTHYPHYNIKHALRKYQLDKKFVTVVSCYIVSACHVCQNAE